MQPRYDAFHPRAPHANRRGRTIVNLVICIAIVALLFAMLLPFQRNVGEAARRSQCKNNLKQIGLALRNYNSVYGALPPAFTTGIDGRPLHSWRTLLLPFLDEQRLYEQIDLSKPWDDPTNAEAAKQHAVNAYRCPSADIPEDHTLYQAVVSPTSWIQRGSSQTFDDPQSSMKSVVITEVDLSRAVHWMQPTDVDEAFWMSDTDSLNTSHVGGLHAIFADGHVQFIGKYIDQSERQSFLPQASPTVEVSKPDNAEAVPSEAIRND